MKLKEVAVRHQCQKLFISGGSDRCLRRKTEWIGKRIVDRKKLTEELLCVFLVADEIVITEKNPGGAELLQSDYLLDDVLNGLVPGLTAKKVDYVTELA